MKKAAFALVFILLASPIFAQNISYNYELPSDFDRVTSPYVNVEIRVQSTYELKSVKAFVGPNMDSMIYNQPAGDYQGTVSLAGVKEDTTTLLIVITDYMNNVDSVVKQFIYVPLPTLIIPEPIDFSVANPTIAVRAYCKDTAHGCTIEINGNGVTYADSVNITLDLSSSEGGETHIPVTATENKYHQSTTQYLHVFIESSPYLKKLASYPDKIWDYNDNQVLTAKTNMPYPPVSNTYYSLTNLKLTNLANGSVTPIPYAGNITFTTGSWDEQYEAGMRAYVTPTGAVFAGIPTSPGQPPYNNDSAYDWNQGALTSVAQNMLNSSSSLQVSGNRMYAIWAEGYPNNFITYRNLATQTDAIVPFPAAMTALNNASGTISSDGTVFFSAGRNLNSSTSFDLYQYRNGNLTVLSDTLEYKFTGSGATDGSRVVYSKILKTTAPDRYQLILHDSVSNTILSDFGTTNPSTLGGWGFDINQGYIAYPKLSPSGILQLWLRDSTGTSTQLTHFGLHSILEKLGPNGDIAFYTYDPQGSDPTALRRYLSDKSGSIQRIGSGRIGKVYYIDGLWYVSIGRNLYGVNFNPVPDSIVSFSRTPVDGSAYSFTSTDFASHFQGDGALMTVKITGLPTKGQLTLYGNPVTLNYEIPRYQLDGLQYVANGALTGADSIQWAAGNGYQYTNNSAWVTLSPLAAPAKPVLHGPGSTYCGGSGMAVTVTITNFPDVSNGYTVNARLDLSALPVAAGGHLSFTPNSLSVGAHTLSVIFTNSQGADTTTASFTILAPSTPAVSLTADQTQLTASITSATLTANNLSGGGINPFYVFASDAALQHILQGPGINNQLSVQASALSVGDNWIYVRMTTSDTCYTTSTAIDSIDLVKAAATTAPAAATARSLTDPDFPDQAISIYPNPVRSQFGITGLQATKTYQITLYTSTGRQVYTQTVTGQQQWSGTGLLTNSGVYALKLYDVTKSRVIGTVSLLRE